ncbi:DMT family transporter [Aggregatibacter kilianii]|uniref:DMT family transporter n=1 Tax=Aggregatibacter kilianii TaxID=2025884 RepID=UPI000D653664|nr:DMT family transporter [Aggregatibacter kilianii]
MNHLRIHLQLIGMAILWGASWPWGRVVAQAMPTFTASASRFFIAIFPLLIWLYAATRFKHVKTLRPAQWFGLFFTAVLGIFAYSTFFIWGLKYVPAGQAAVIVTTNPVFTMIFAIFLFNEKWNRWVLLGMAVAISGPLIAITKGHPLQMLEALGFGQVLLICAMFCWVSYTLLARKVLQGIDSLTATTVSSVFGFLLLFIAALTLENTTDWRSVLTLSQSVWMSLIGLSLGATVLAYAWYFDGVKHLGAGNAAAYIVLIPIFGIIFSAIWLKEQVDSSLFIGGLLAVSGLALMHWGRRLIK